MIKDVLNDFAGIVGGAVDKLAKDVESLKKAASRGKAVELHDKADLRLGDPFSYRFGSSLTESETDIAARDEFERAKDKEVTWNGKRLLPSPYVNTAFTKYKESKTNGLYRPLSVFLEASGQNPPLGFETVNLIPFDKLDGLKINIPNASSVSVMVYGRPGVGVPGYDYIIRTRNVADTEDYKEKQIVAWSIAGNDSVRWKYSAANASFSDGILTLSSGIGGAIIAVVFNDGSRACYKIASRSAGFANAYKFTTSLQKVEVEAVNGGTSQEELDGITRHEWGEDVVYPPIPEVEQFYTPTQAHLKLNDLELDGEPDSPDDYRIVNASVLLPESLTEQEVMDILKATRGNKTNSRLKRPVITLTKGKEYKFKVKGAALPMLSGNVATTSDGIVTVSANATEKDSVFGDAMCLVIV
ncbi:hypothetical protein [Neisseria bergeri]|uniref:hypothetical protein n=1 Tax=Neisseria bergeri TaxID=1906581 RepID=UPI0027E1BC7E|nr:hypothetical protein [Neisseria bergeri]